jgi:hypothetical protein
MPNDQDPDQDHDDTTSVVEAGSTTSGDIVHSGERLVVHDGTVEILGGPDDHDQDSDKPDSDAAKTVANDLKQWFDPNTTFAGTVAGGDHNPA